MSTAGSLVVFAKAPRAGQVKTRLCPPLTPEQAAELYACMLDDVLEASAAACAELGLAPVLAVHPPEAVPELSARAPAAFRAVAQQGADLGERMQAAAEDAAARVAGPVLLRGSDSPALPQGTIAEVLAALAGAELAAAPADDGGYDLIGLARPVPGVFSHPMSTGSVLADTLAAARGRGLRCQVLDAAFASFDVDRVSDLARLAALRRAGHTSPCPRTLAYLDDQGLWKLANLCAEPNIEAAG